MGNGDFSVDELWTEHPTGWLQSLEGRRREQEGSGAAAATGSVKEAGGHSNAYRCDLLFWASLELLAVHFIRVHHHRLRVHLPKH